MKRFSLFAWALVALMSLSLYSCDPSSDEDDTSVTQMLIGKLTDSSISGGYFISGEGIKLNPTNFPVYSYSPGLYMFTCTYNPNLVVNNELSITINSSELVNMSNPYGIVSSSFVTDDNMPLYGIHVQVNNNEFFPWMFDDQYLIIPICFWGPSVSTQTEFNTELAKHRFILSYEEPSASDTVLKLRLTDKIDEESPSNGRDSNYHDEQAFDITGVVAYFKDITGHEPSQISISGKVNQSRSVYDLAKEETYTINLN